VGVFHTHLVAGSLGGFCTGLFATTDGCAAFGLTNPGGAIDGNGKQVWLQIVGALFIIGLNAFMTSVVLLFIKYVLRIPLRMTEEHLLVGDDAVHGEEAYALFFEGQRSHISQADVESAHLTEGHSISGAEGGNGESSAKKID
jgi:ammonium transporter, Amt family